MDEQKNYGDGVVTGHGTIEGRKVSNSNLFIYYYYFNLYSSNLI